jgi:hypothetical protein
MDTWANIAKYHISPYLFRVSGKHSVEAVWNRDTLFSVRKLYLLLQVKRRYMYSSHQEAVLKIQNQATGS